MDQEKPATSSILTKQRTMAGATGRGRRQAVSSLPARQEHEGSCHHLITSINLAGPNVQSKPTSLLPETVRG